MCLSSFKANQQAAGLGIVAAKPLAAVDVDICLPHLRQDHILQLPGCSSGILLSQLSNKSYCTNRLFERLPCNAGILCTDFL